MRLRSLVSVFATSCLLAAAVLRCSIPPTPPPSSAIPTRIGRARGAFLALPGGTLPGVDRAALVASLKEMKFTTIILQTTANEDGEFVSDGVALAVELQRELEADVFIGTYQASAHKLNGKPMEALLQTDANAQKVADELTRLGASSRIGCFIPQQPELVDTLTDDKRAKLQELLRDAAGPCAKSKRDVLLSPLLSNHGTDPARAGLLLRDVLKDTGITRVVLQDGVGAFDPQNPRRAAPYYDALRVALDDRPDNPVQVWANIEAFDCEGPACDRTHPTTTARLTEQLCGARARVEGIVTYEYLHHLAGQPLVTGDLDASTDLQAIADDVDAAAQLRRGYLEWFEAGAPCAQ